MARTVGALSLTWEPKYRKPFEPLLDVTHVPYNNVERLDAAIDDETAMVIVEPVQGEGGVNIGRRRVPAGGPATVPRAWRASGGRRNPDRFWAHGALVWAWSITASSRTSSA